MGRLYQKQKLDLSKTLVVTKPFVHSGRLLEQGSKFKKEWALDERRLRCLFDSRKIQHPKEEPVELHSE